jgi:hypothetical protein
LEAQRTAVSKFAADNGMDVIAEFVEARVLMHWTAGRNSPQRSRSPARTSARSPSPSLTGCLAMSLSSLA